MPLCQIFLKGCFIRSITGLPLSFSSRWSVHQLESNVPPFLFLIGRQLDCRVRLATGLQITHSHLGNLQLVSQYLTILGNLALALHDTGQAREILRSALTLSKKLYDIPTQIWVLTNLTGIYLPPLLFSFSIHFLVRESSLVNYKP